MRFIREKWRLLLAALGGLAVLAAAAGAVYLFIQAIQPQAAPTAGGKAMGSVSEPDASGSRTYDSRTLHFRFRYPSQWRLTESAGRRESEGDYLTIALLPATADAKGTLDPPLLEVVPDPQGFSADAIARMKWGSASATLTVTTQTAEVAGKRAVEVMVSETRPSKKPLYTYDLIATPGGRMFDLGFSTSDMAEFEAVREQLRRLAASIETY